MYECVFPNITENERRLPVYLYGVGCWHNQEHVQRTRGTVFFQWTQCFGGEGELLVGGQKYSIRKGQGMLLYPGLPHEYYGVTERWDVDWIAFQGYHMEYFLKNIGLDGCGTYFVANTEGILAKMRKILRTAQSGSALKWFECSTGIYDLLMDLAKYASKNNDDSIHKQYLRLKPVFEYIDKKYAEVITLKMLADLIGVTPQHFCLLFKEASGVRPFDYINSIRIKKGKELLIRNKAAGIDEVSRMLGYESVSYFCLVFRRIEGITPGRFKKMYGV